jgi:hypothetical protein
MHDARMGTHVQQPITRGLRRPVHSSRQLSHASPGVSGVHHCKHWHWHAIFKWDTRCSAGQEGQGSRSVGVGKSMVPGASTRQGPISQHRPSHILPHGPLTEMGHGPHMGRGSSGWRARGIVVRGPLHWRMGCESRCGHGAASVGKPGVNVLRLGTLAILRVAGCTVASHMHALCRSKSAHTVCVAQSSQQPSCLCECVCHGVLVVFATVTVPDATT